MLSLKKENKLHSSSFKFMKMWSRHPDSEKLVKEVWETPVYGNPMFILSQKLKNLKARLKDWNKNIFGDVHSKVNLALAEVDRIQNQINFSGGSDDLFSRKRMFKFSCSKLWLMKRISGKKNQE